MKRLLQILSVCLLTTAMIGTAQLSSKDESVVSETVVVENVVYASTPNDDHIEVFELVKSVEESRFSEEDIDLIALLTMAEAEGESEYGKRLVIDTVLNRVDSEHFPDTVYGVIYQENQFSPISDGRIERCYVDEGIRKLVLDEVESRTNYDTIFFHAGRYSNYGTQLFSEGNHYFSSYE